MKMPPVTAGAERIATHITLYYQWFHPEIIDWYERSLKSVPWRAKRKSKTDADVICPVHDDHNPSLGVDLRQNGAGLRWFSI